MEMSPLEHPKPVEDKVSQRPAKAVGPLRHGTDSSSCVGRAGTCHAQPPPLARALSCSGNYQPLSFHKMATSSCVSPPVPSQVFLQADGLGEVYAAARFEHTVVASTKLETKLRTSVLPCFTKFCCSEVSCLPVLPSPQTTFCTVSPLPVGPFPSARLVGVRGAPASLSHKLGPTAWQQSRLWRTVRGECGHLHSSLHPASGLTCHPRQQLNLSWAPIPIYKWS